MENQADLIGILLVSIPFVYYLVSSISKNREFRNSISQKSNVMKQNYTPQSHVTDRFNNLENMEKEELRKQADKYNDSINEIGK